MKHSRVCPAMEGYRCPSHPACRRERDDQALFKNSQSDLLREDGRNWKKESEKDDWSMKASPRQEVNMVKDQLRPQAQRTQFDPIPMKYAYLLPALLKKHLVQTRPPPKVPERLPAWYKPDKFCAFHQGAPGHDIEYCYALKAAVQKLIRDKDLSFET
ncbi:hypothetical protein MTR_4g045943 [Medicago truncatula]|uniref:Uncharacterized protein n=1 Tax=Medicago truncatula TaxID=3880 RepID=A0A072UIU1_MEDTR|nr:hypothetical protein MTR_4g045943 [Medicago truncatula]